MAVVDALNAIYHDVNFFCWSGIMIFEDIEEIGIYFTE
jgi:hypothetical protein